MSSTDTSVARAPRNIAVDAYRGFVMLLMMGEVLRLSQVSAAFAGNGFWALLAFNQSHVEWAGASLHDMIQPSFSFLVGVALPYSIAARLARGGTPTRLFLHAAWRSLILIYLGILLRSLHAPMFNFTFEDTLTQIGLGYPFLFLLGFARPRWQWVAFGGIVFFYWLAWALYPVAAPGFDWRSVGVPLNWEHLYTGFLAHWNKNANLGQAFDLWFLNLFPRQRPFLYNGGGYLTLSFIPTLGTMLLGLIAGRWLRDAAPRVPVRKLLIAGVVCLAAGVALHFGGLCPVVKRIWTPAWVLASGGACFLFLATFSWVIDVHGMRRWAFPLVVIGMNSIAAYLIAHLLEGLTSQLVRIHLGPALLAALGPGLATLTQGVAVLALFWALLWWMHRHKFFVKI